MEVPADVVEALGAGRQPAVTVTVGAHTYRSTVAVRGGTYLLPLSAENRAAAGVGAGDEVDVHVELDTAPRELTAPDDLAALLNADAGAKATFDRLSYSRQLRHILAVEGAKTPETRRRRLDKTIATLRAD